MNVLKNKHGLSIEGKIRILGELRKPLAAVRDAVARSLYVKEISEQLGIDENIILERIKTSRSQTLITGHPDHYRHPLPDGRSTSPELPNRKVEKEPLELDSRIERQLIALIIQYPVTLPMIREKNLLAHFKNGLLKSIGEKLLLYYRQIHRKSLPIPAPQDKNATQSWIASFVRFANDAQEESMITALALEELSWDEKGSEQLIHQFITTANYRQNKLKLEAQIKKAEQENNEQLLIELLAKRQKLAESSEKRKMAIMTGQSHQL